MAKRNRISRASFLAIIVILAVSCQEEKYTDKGIPEVEVTAITILEEGGAVFEGRILSTGEDEIIEHGFLWDTDENPVPGTAEQALLGPGQGKETFTCNVTADIQKDRKYYIRAFVITPDCVSLSAVISFKGSGSKQPELISVTPAEAISGDTVVIKGNNFSFTAANNRVYFGGKEAVVLYSDVSEARVIVPYLEEIPTRITINVSGLGSPDTLNFSVLPPVLTSFSPLTGTFNDIITLSGSNFSTDPSHAGVYFNSYRAEILEMSRTHYKVRVPPENNISPVVIRVKGFNYFSYGEPFILKQAVITGVSPASVHMEDMIVVSGQNFNPLSHLNTVMIGGQQVHIESCSPTEIAFRMPRGLSGGEYTLSIMTLQGDQVTWSGTIELISPWRRLNDFPGNARSSPTVFATENFGYIGLGHDSKELGDFWRYSPSADEWTRISDFPIALLEYASGFAVDGSGYVTLGKVDGTYSKAITRYTPSSDTWETLGEKPGDGSSMKSPVFTVNGKAYVCAGEEMYEFDPSLNLWTKKIYPAELQYFGSGVAFSVGDKGYMGIGWIHQQGINTPWLLEYDPLYNSWTRMADFPGTLRSNSVFFTLPNGKAYVGLGTTTDEVYLRDMWEFDPVSNSWTRLADFPGTARYSAVAFSVGSKAYIGFGFDGQHMRDIWEFDPARLN